MPPVDNHKVAIYIRWSSEDQSEGTTLDVQRDRCRHYAMSQGLGEVPDERIFIDDGYSGGSLDRPAMTKLRQLVRARKVAAVVVYKIDRLSRNIVDAVDLVLREWDSVCRLACVMEPVDTTTELGRMFFGVLAMFADFERSTIRQRMQSGKVRRAQEGRNPGMGLPYGYTHGATPGKVEVVESQAIVVKRIFEMYDSGMGSTVIATALNREGIPPAKATLWANTSIVRLLQNPAYMGKFIYGRTQVNPRFGKDDGAKLYLVRDEPLASLDGTFPPLIDEDTFLRCQEIRTSKVSSKRGRANTSQYLLTGLAKCKCGSALQGSMAADRSGAMSFRYYSCRAKISKGVDACDAGTLPVEELDAVVVQRAKQLLLPTNKERLVDQARQRTMDDIATIEVRLADVDAEMAGFDSQEARAKRDYKRGDLPAKLYAELCEEMEQARSTATAMRSALLAQLEQVRVATDDYREMERLLSLVEAWDNLDMPQRKHLLASLVEEVVAYRRRRSKSPVELRIEMKRL